MAHGDDDVDHEEGIGPQEIDAGPVSVVVLFGAVTTVILIFLTIMFFNFMQHMVMETKGLDEPNERVVSIVAEQRKQLESHAVVDAKKGLVSVPIETAMAMIVEQRKKDPNPHIVPVAPQPGQPGAPADAKGAAKETSQRSDKGKAAEAKKADEKKEPAKSGDKKGDEKH